MDECYIINAKRTPRGIGKPSGSLYRVMAVDLLSQALQSVVTKNITSHIEEVITGCVMPVGEQGANIARTAILKAGLPHHTPGMQINRFCSSGLDAMNLIAYKIMAKQASLCIASGIECMSRTPILADGGALVADPSIVYKHNIIPQGVSADLIATLNGYSRKQLDEYALLSQQRATEAINKNHLKSIIPVYNQLGDIVLDHDELPRPNASLKALHALKPSFRMAGEIGGFDALATFKYPSIETVSHLHHAGNSSGIADGAAAILLANNQSIEQFNLRPIAKIVSTAQVGIDPTIMLTGPIQAVEAALKRAKLQTSDIDLWEINEAFSAVAINIIEGLKISYDTVNIHGGAIAFGHPLGATGAMLVSSLIDALKQKRKQRGCVVLCTAAGMASCCIIERV